MFKRIVVAALAAAGLVAGSGVARAAPADDYQRGLQAYQRGDVVGAMAALKPAADAGHADAQQMLAFILDRADFVDEAVALYRKAAAQDQPEAHAALGLLAASGRGVAKDENAALRHFSKAAALGHGKSIELVAEAYLQGQLGLAGRRDTPEGEAAVRRAAERGHLPSMNALAAAYTQGGFGLAPDAALAAQWRAKATETQRQRAAQPAGGGSR